MTVVRNVYDRTDLLPHWLPSLPTEERIERLQRWKQYKSCVDCKYWEIEENGDVVGICALFTLGAFNTPADYTCELFQPLEVKNA